MAGSCDILALLATVVGDNLEVFERVRSAIIWLT